MTITPPYSRSITPETLFRIVKPVTRSEQQPATLTAVIKLFSGIVKLCFCIVKLFLFILDLLFKISVQLLISQLFTLLRKSFQPVLSTCITPLPEGNSFVTLRRLASISFCSEVSVERPFSSMVIAARAAICSQSSSSSLS